MHQGTKHLVIIDPSPAMARFGARYVVHAGYINFGIDR
jgi:hypothetical protein